MLRGAEAERCRCSEETRHTGAHAQRCGPIHKAWWALTLIPQTEPSEMDRRGAMRLEDGCNPELVVWALAAAAMGHGAYKLRE